MPADKTAAVMAGPNTELWCICQDLSSRIGAAVALEEAHAENEAFGAEATLLEACLRELQRWGGSCIRAQPSMLGVVRHASDVSASCMWEGGHPGSMPAFLRSNALGALFH